MVRFLPASRLLFLTAAIILQGCRLLAQEPDKQQKQNEEQAAIKALVDSRQFIFEAQSATPMRGTTRQLTSVYTLKLNRDTLQADLPYFGRAYIVTYGSTETGIAFKTSDFDYAIEDAKKGGWNISLSPKKIKDVNKMSLFVSASGYGTLQVTSNTREMISFYGYIHQVNYPLAKDQ
jgi:hypothetical protein